MKSPISLQNFITFVFQIFSRLFFGFFSECVMFSHFIEFQTNDLQRHPILGLYNHVHSILHPLQPNKSTHQDGFYERRSEEHTSELQSRGHLVCRLLLEKKKTTRIPVIITTRTSKN